MLDPIFAREIIDGTNGRLFSVRFTKRTTGEERLLVGRLGVKKHLRGGRLPYNPRSHNLLIVFDVQKEGYRAVPLDAIYEIRADGEVYKG